MARKHNPYQLWLGLAPQLTNPNLFQLLGIDPDSTDDAAMKEMAKVSAKSLLNKLRAVKTKTDGERKIKQKLNEKIMLAHETISSPEKRKIYLRKLRQSAANPHPRTAPGTNAQSPGTSTENPTPSPGVPPMAISDIPHAIPIAIPVTALPPTTPPITTPAASGISPPPSPTGLNAIGGSVEPPLPGNQNPNFSSLNAEPVVKIVPVRRKTSRSWIVPLVVLVLIVGGISGLLSLVSKYNNILELIPRNQQQVESTNSSTSSPATPGSTESSAGVPPQTPISDATPGNLNSIDASTKRETVANRSPDEHLKTGLPRDITIVGAPGSNTSNPAIVSTPDTPVDGGLTGGDSFPRPDPPNSKTDANLIGGADNPFDIPVADVARRLTDPQLTSLRLAHHRSRDALFRQDTKLAIAYNVEARQLLQRYNATLPDEFVAEQRGLIQSIESLEQIVGWVEEFWRQVKTSSAQMAGGLGVEVGEKTIGLVEGRQTDVVLRIAGKNTAIEYQDLTPVLAITLGELATINDVPQWNLAKSAFLATKLPQYPDLESRQNAFLEQAATDGYDLQRDLIVAYNATQWAQLGLPNEKTGPLSDSQFKTLIGGVRRSLDYKDPVSLSDDRIDQLIYLLTLSPHPDPQTHLACLWEAVNVIKRGQRIFDLLYVNRELTICCTEVDFEKSFVRPILEAVETNKTPSFYDDAARQTLIFLTRFQDDPNLKPASRQRLIDLVRVIAREIDNDQLAAMANQIANAANESP